MNHHWMLAGIVSLVLCMGVGVATAGDVRVNYFKDCRDCPEMTVVPAGSFQMGDISGNGTNREKPVHTVTIAKPFAIGRYEVTFAEWDACVADQACRHKPGDEGWGRGRRAVFEVSQLDAREYASWLSQRTGHKYRLPSEAEWEYAARAGSSTVYWWGDRLTTDKASFGQDSETDFPMPFVGSYAPNDFGLYDVHGNVREWVEDCWHKSYSGAPADGSAWTQKCDEYWGIIRGGAFNRDPGQLRSAWRDIHPPVNRHRNLGFRIAMTLE